MTRQQKRHLRELWDSWSAEVEDNVRDARTLNTMSFDEEKQHRGGLRAGGYPGMSVADAANYFTLRWLCRFKWPSDDSEFERSGPKPEEFFRIKTSLFGAWALLRGDSSAGVVNNWLETNEDALRVLMAWDYVELIK